MRVSAYVGRSTIHAGNVSLILNISMGHVSPQFHVVFDEYFSTVPSLKMDQFQIPGSSFAKIIENSLRTEISVWHIYGANLSRKVASNLISKRAQLKIVSTTKRWCINKL